MNHRGLGRPSLRGSVALSACYRGYDLRVVETTCEAGPVGSHEETVRHSIYINVYRMSSALWDKGAAASLY